MAFGLWTTQRGNKHSAAVRDPQTQPLHCSAWAGAKACATAAALVAVCSIHTLAYGQLFGKKPAPAAPPTPPIAAAPTCDKPLYLTLDTGHMDVAQLMADVLNKHQVKATFFVANERTKDDKGSMSFEWGQKFWAQRGQEGHDFASHTWDHVYWKGDVKGNSPAFVVQPTAGAFAGRSFTWEAPKYCAQITQARERIEDFTGKKALPIWRAPGGKTSKKVIEMAEACGYKHVGWAPAGFLGDELPDSTSNDALLKKALRDIKGGDILMAHLGIWSRKDPWAPAVLEPLIVGLKEKGFCFTTLRHHPDYKAWYASHPLN
jgi:peptidoglycan/xylan/chitin deacetylase (PgdA/CDA1 family)